MSDAGRTGRPLEVVVVEPWYGGSHRAWADGLVRHSRHAVRLVTHPDRFWRWRLRGGAVTLAEELRADVDAHGRPDVLVVSSLVHGAAMLGLTRRSVGDVPVVAYVHESQLAYPTTDGRAPDTDAAMANWQTLLAADAVWWNSAFHRDTVLEALPAFLDAAPDLTHRGLIAKVEAKSAVVPVGVELDGLLGAERESSASLDDGPLVLWNQRWEHDKDPLGWLRIMAHLADAGVAFRLALAGERPRERDAEATRLVHRLEDRIEVDRYLEPDAYRALLVRSDVFLSCARHEFFGISVVEAIAAGCVPVLPDALSHPGLVPDRWHDVVLYEPGRAQAALAAVLDDVDGARARVAGLRQAMERWSWRSVIDQYDAGLSALRRPEEFSEEDSAKLESVERLRSRPGAKRLRRVPESKGDRMRVIIDTDPGMGSRGADPEDGLAILFALGSPEVTLEAITVAAGNVPTSHSWSNLHRLLELSGRTEVPVRAGAASPLSTDRIPQNAYLRMREGVGQDVPVVPLPDDDAGAAELIRDTVLAAPGEITIVGIGPLTNVARAIQLDATVAAAMARLVIMGGTVEVAGNVTPAAEFNIWMDPEAADIVFRSGAAITMVGLDVCHQTHFDLTQVAALRGNGVLADFVADAASSWIEAREQFWDESDLHLYDSLAMAAAIHPDVVETGPALVEIETGDGPAQGMTVAWINDVLRRVLTGREPNADVAVGVDLERFEHLFRTRVLTPLESVPR